MRLLFLATILFLSLSVVSAQQPFTGSLYADEITGFTEQHVTINAVSAEYAQIQTLTSYGLNATPENGFTLNAVGGVSTVSQGNVAVSSTGALRVSAAVSGDNIISGTSTTFSSPSGNVNVVSADDALIASTNSLSFTTQQGNFNVDSFMGTSFDSVDGISISTQYRDLSITAPTGDANLNGNILNIIAGVDGDAVVFNTTGNINLDAVETWDFDAQGNIQLSSSGDLSLLSTAEFIDLRAANTISFSSARSILFNTKNDIVYNVEDGNLNVQAGTDLAYIGYSTVFNSTNGDMNLFGTGDESSVNMNAAGSVTTSDLTGVSIYSIHTANFTSRSSITVDTNQALQLTSNNGFQISSYSVSLNAYANFNVDLANGAPLALTATGPGDVVFNSADITFSSSSLASTFDITGQDSILFVTATGFPGFDGSVLYGNINLNIGNNVIANFTNTADFLDSDFIQLNAAFTAINAQQSLLVFATAAFTCQIDGLSATNIQIEADHTVEMSSATTSILGNTNTTFSGSDTLDFNAESLQISGATVSFQTIDGNLNIFAPGNIIATTATDAISINGASTRADEEILFYGNSASINTGGFSASAEDINFNAFSTFYINPSDIAVLNSNTIIRHDSRQQTSISATDVVISSNLFLRSSAQGQISFTDEAHFNSHSGIDFVSNEAALSATNLLTVESGNNFLFESDFQLTFNTDEIELNTTQTTTFQSGYLNIHAGSVTGRSLSASFSTLEGGNVLVSSSSLLLTTGGFLDIYSGIISLDTGGNNDIDITSGGDINADSASGSDIEFLTHGSFTGSSNNLGFAGNNVDLSAYSQFSLISQNVSLLAINEANFTSSDSFTFDTDSQLSFSGQNAYFNTGDRFTLDSYSANFTSCSASGKFLINFDNFLFTVNSNIVVDNNPSNCALFDVPNSNFTIISAARVQQTLQSATSTNFNANNGFQISGGDIGFTSYNGATTVTSSSGTSISTSGNQNVLLDNPRSLEMSAIQNIYYNATGTINISTGARDNNNLHLPYGMKFIAGNSAASSIVFNAPAGENTFQAVGNLFLGTNRPLSNGFVNVSQDFVVGSSQSIGLSGASIQIVSGSKVNTKGLSTRNNAEGVLFSSPNGDIDVLAPASSIAYSAIVSQFTSNTSYITFSTTGNINETAIYNETVSTNFGHIHFNIGKSIFITSGRTQRDGEITFLSSGDFSINTYGMQRYHSFGISSNNNIQSISLLSQQGNFAVNAATNLDIISGGRSNFLSNAGSFQLAAKDSIFFSNFGEFSLESTTDSSVTANTGSIYLTASGSNGGFSLLSDSNQSVDFFAGKSVLINAGGNSTFLARTGIQAITTTGNINLQNNGFGQNSLFHSGGNVVLQAGSTAGAFFYARNFRWLAQNDVQIDASTVAIGALANTLTSTHPIVSINAGGDSQHNGIQVSSVGSINWNTNRGSLLSLDAYNFDLSANAAINVNSNGPITFENTGKLDDGTFLVQTLVGTLSYQGQYNAALDSETTTTLRSQNNFVITSSGTNPGNNITIQASVAATFNAQNSISLNTGAAEFNFYDGSITAASTVTIQNPLGTEGSLGFQSNQNIVGSSISSTSFTSAAPLIIRSLGVLSPINFNTTNGSPISVTAGSEMFVSGNDVLADGSNGLNITSTSGNVIFKSTANTKFVANQTITIAARSSYIVTAGDSSAQSNIEMEAQGALVFQSVNDLTLNSIANGPSNILSKAISIEGDSGVTFQNLLAAKSKNQGDITLISTLSSDYVAAQGNLLSSGGRDTILALVTGPTTFESDGSLTIETTAAGANIAFNLGNNLNLQGGSGFYVTAGDVNTAAGVLFSGQTLIVQSGLDGLYPTPGVISGFNLQATGGNIRFQVDNGGSFNLNVASFGTLSSSGTTTLISNFGTLQIAADYEVAITAGNAAVFNGYSSIAINVENGDPLTTPNLAGQRASNLVIDGYLSGGNAVNIAGSTVSFNTDTTTSNFAIEAAQTLLLNSYTQGTSFTGQYIEMHSNGLDPGDHYAAYFQANSQINFEGNNIVVASLAGSANITARQNTQIISHTTFAANANNILRIQSGFVEEPLAPLGPQRAGITIAPNSNDALFIAESGNIVINAYDVSFSTAGTLTINAQQSQGRVVLESLNNVGVSSGGPLSFSALEGQFDLNTAGALSVNAPSITVQAEGSLYAFTNGNINFQALTTISINAQSVLLNAPIVNFAPTNTELMVLPSNFRAKFNSHTSSYFEEPNYRGCKEKEFIFDTATTAFCYCYNNFWRCTGP